MTPYKRFQKRWNNCTDCFLCKKRNKIVLLRGKVPCSVLFIGEAPGVSEDLLGKPFVGPAGKLLDKIIKEATDSKDYALTNLVACIPKNEEGNKVSEPSEECIKACQERLQATVALCRPKVIVQVGKLAKKWVPKLLGNGFSYVTIVHPAAILRADPMQRQLTIQRSIVMVRDAFSF